jgi:N-acetyl-gamma-glutamyl-phosphate reductase
VPLFGANPKAIRETLAEAYAESPIVKLRDIEGDTLTIEHAAGSDRLDLFVFTNGSQTRLTAALDNLGKGASGAAVQSLNLMAGLPEVTGLRL